MATPKSRITPFMKQCFVTGSVCFNIIGHGCVLGFPAVLLPQLRQPGSSLLVTAEAESWIASVMGITLFVGIFMMPPIMGCLGRKVAHFVVIVPVVIGWMVTILATSSEALIIGRVMKGLSFGMLLPLRSALIGEYTSPKNRGAFLTTVSLAQGFGIFFAHVVGSFISWKKTALICLFFSITSLIMTIYSPESPSWLAAKGRYHECKTVFRWLRGYEEEDELKEMIQARVLIEKEGDKKSSLKDMTGTIKKKEFYKPIILMLHAYAMSQLGGAATTAAYPTVVISLIVGTSDNIHLWIIAMDSLRLCSNIGAVYVINRTKRRTMMTTSGVICVGVHLAIAAYVYAKNNNLLLFDSVLIPGLLLSIQFFSIATGTIALPSVIAGEVFPLQYRSVGGSISLVAISLSMFVILKTFPGLIESTGMHGVYLIYAGTLAYTFIVIWMLLPETKDRTLQQIEDEFRGGPLEKEEVDGKSLKCYEIVTINRRDGDKKCSTPLL